MSAHRATVGRAEVIEHLARRMEFAERGAEMVHRYLVANGWAGTPEEPRPIHPEIALELWGVLQLYAWEAAGLHTSISADLPSAEQAGVDLNRRLKNSPDDLLAQGAGTLLSARIMDTWLRFCDANGPRVLGVDVVVGSRPTESILRELADWLWRHRHLASHQDESK